MFIKPKGGNIVKTFLTKISSWRYGKGNYNIIFNVGLMVLVYSILDLVFNQTIRNPYLAGVGLIFMAIAIFVTESEKRR